MTPLPLISGAPLHSGPVLLIDNSTLDQYNNCPREGQYGHIENLTSADDKPALNFGAGVHEAMKWRYQNCGSGVVSQVAWEKQVDLMIAFFVEHPQPLDSHRSPSLCQELISTYNDHYQQEPWEIMTNPKTGERCVEQSVLHYLGDLPARLWTPNDDPKWGPFLASEIRLPIYYTGRIDLIVKDPQKSTWIVDHKTTFAFGPSFTESMSMSAQFLGYAWAFRETFGYAPTGYMINAIRVRKPTKADELSGIHFRSKGADTDFIRIPFMNVTDDLLDEWQENALALVKTILYHHSQSYFPMNRTACVRKYGRCQFFEVCNCARQSREVILTSQAFAQNEWHPLNVAKRDFTLGQTQINNKINETTTT